MSAPGLKKLVDQDEALARGVSHVIVDANQDSAVATVSLFLRSYRGRIDCAETLPQDPEPAFVRQLESLRNSLYSGDLQKAERELEVLKPKNELEEAELSVELCRFHLFKGEIGRALQLSAQALQNPVLPELSRMTCFQLRGHCHISLGDFAEAISELRRAVALAETYPNAGSAFSAHAFLVQAYSEMGDQENASIALDALRGRLNAISQEELWLDRLLTVIRSETHFWRVFKDPMQWFAAAEEGRELCIFLNEQTTLKKCERDLLNARAAKGENKGEPAILKFSGWSYFPKRMLVLSSFPRKIVRLQQSPVATKILAALAQEAMSSQGLFEKVWNLKYDPERHSNHLRAALSKLRKLLPPGALVVDGGIVKLV